jgi:HSP20 family protein
MSRRSNPFDELERLIDRMSEQFEGNLGDLAGTDVPLDVEDREDAFVVTADLPGYDRDDVEVELSDDRLHLRATRETVAEETGEHRVVRRERQTSVSRTVDLPGAVAEDEVSATYGGGVLTVTLPKAGEGGGGHRIDIE